MNRIANVAVIGNYLPRKCGIATFTTDLVTALSDSKKDLNCWAVAMNDRPDGYRYPSKVKFEINQNSIEEYRLACEFLNINQVDIVSIQHEYGIFGGEAGCYILQLIRQLRVPVVTTLHTVLQNPEPPQKKVLKELADLSAKVVVMSEQAVDFLNTIYDIPRGKIALIHHGIPDMPFVDSGFYKDQFGVEGKKVVLTFGLLSQNKGIEYMIRALPTIVEKHPEVVYIVLGATHPHIKRSQGEEYRQSLVQLAANLGVEDNVLFFNRFVEIQELCEFLGAADIYVTPYLNEAQIVSGTLAYAMGSGKATVSTPYWYAREMLDNNRGVLCSFKDSEGLSLAINDLLHNEIKRNAVRKNAYTFSRNATWSQAACHYLTLFSEVKAQRASQPVFCCNSPFFILKKSTLPELNLNHLLTLTDDTGILQHATFTIPERNHGYCLDDNSRGLIFSILAQNLLPDTKTAFDLQKRYLSFISHAYNSQTTSFRNFMSYNRVWLEEQGSQDSQGRALWALGVCCALSRESGCVALATNLFHKGLTVASRLHHPRAISFSLVGIHAYLARFSGDTKVKRVRLELAQKLSSAFSNSTSENWPWFNDILTYANAKIPQALLLCGQWLAKDDMLQKGFSLLDWLIQLQVTDNRFSPIGNDGWYLKDRSVPKFDQQPIEAQAMIETCLLASKMTENSNYYEMAKKTFNWFLGENDLGMPLYDYSNGGCRDGLTPDGPNLNEGAESTLAWLLSLVSMHNYESEIKNLHFTSSFGLEQQDEAVSGNLLSEVETTSSGA